MRMVKDIDLFPQEHFVELKGLSHFLVGRIVVDKGHRGFDAQIDIIQVESGKIYNHVAILYGQMDAKEALDLGVHQLKKFLENSAKKKMN
jgi:hypothetical protein